jgi:hypothetical protein
MKDITISELEGNVPRKGDPGKRKPANTIKLFERAN